MGARPLRRVIEEQIEDKIAEFYLENPEVGGINVTVNEDNDIVVERGQEDETLEETDDEIEAETAVEDVTETEDDNDTNEDSNTEE